MSPPVDERIFQPKWRKALRMSPISIPELPVEFVAEQGRSLHIIDVREREELQDLVGHIPGSIWVPLSRIAEVPAKLGRHTPIVLVSRRGTRAGTAAQYLRALGMDSVAVLAGGMLAWRALGYSTSRHERILQRPLAPAAPLAEPSDAPLTKADIERHVGDLTQVRWLRLAALIVNGKRSCVDGRDEQGVIGTPGGDAGELVMAFGCLERVTGRELSDDAVEALLARELDTFGRFYMHTDTHAWAKCLAAMKSDPRLRSAVPPDANDADWVALANHAPVEARPALLEHFENPAHLGCGHLRLMLTKPEQYGVRPGLIRSFLRAFHNLHWRGAPELELVTLGGEHDESAVLQVFVEQELWDFSEIPLVSPTVGQRQVFVAHPQVAHRHRNHYVDFFARAGSLVGLEARRVEAFRAELHGLAGKHLGATLGHLADGLPLFEVHFEGDHRVRVVEAGRVSKG